ncbi:hypothetical protein, partial [Vibrio cholerae]
IINQANGAFSVVIKRLKDVTMNETIKINNVVIFLLIRNSKKLYIDKKIDILCNTNLKYPYPENAFVILLRDKLISVVLAPFKSSIKAILGTMCR